MSPKKRAFVVLAMLTAATAGWAGLVVGCGPASPEPQTSAGAGAAKPKESVPQKLGAVQEADGTWSYSYVLPANSWQLYPDNKWLPSPYKLSYPNLGITIKTYIGQSLGRDGILATPTVTILENGMPRSTSSRRRPPSRATRSSSARARGRRIPRSSRSTSPVCAPVRTTTSRRAASASARRPRRPFAAIPRTRTTPVPPRRTRTRSTVRSTTRSAHRRRLRPRARPRAAAASGAPARNELEMTRDSRLSPAERRWG